MPDKSREAGAQAHMAEAAAGFPSFQSSAQPDGPCPFRYVCERGHELDTAEPVTRCPEPCGAALSHTLDGRTTDPEEGYLSPDERLRRFGKL